MKLRPNEDEEGDKNVNQPKSLVSRSLTLQRKFRVATEKRISLHPRDTGCCTSSPAGACWLWRAAPGCVWALCVQLLTRVRASSQRGLPGAWLADGQPERGPCQQVPIACCLCWCTVHGVADARPVICACTAAAAPCSFDSDAQSLGCLCGAPGAVHWSEDGLQPRCAPQC